MIRLTLTCCTVLLALAVGAFIFDRLRDTYAEGV